MRSSVLPQGLNTPPTFLIDGLGKHGGVTRSFQEQMTSSRFIRAILGISHRELGWGRRLISNLCDIRGKVWIQPISFGLLLSL